MLVTFIASVFSTSVENMCVGVYCLQCQRLVICPSQQHLVVNLTVPTLRHHSSILTVMSTLIRELLQTWWHIDNCRQHWLLQVDSSYISRLVMNIHSVSAPCGLRGCKNGPLRFLAECRTRRLNQA